MAYNISKSDGTSVTIPTGAIDNQFDVPLIGQDAVNYGDDLALAFVRLLENFANDTAPAFGDGRTTGQLWYDTSGSTSVLKVWNGASWDALARDAEVVKITGDQTVSGIKSFTQIPNFNGGTSGADAPFNVDSTFVVTNLNAEFLDDGGTPRPASYFAVAGESVGKKTMYVPADKMYPATTNGAAGTGTGLPATVALTPGNPELRVWDFDSATRENVQFNIAFPKSWDEGTVTFQVFWTANDATTDGVSWGLEAVAVGDGGPIDAAFGTAIVVDDANQGTANDLLVTAESSAVTIAGIPGEDNVVYFQLYRDVGDANDVMAVDARLIGVKVFYTTDAPTDA